VFVVPVGWVVWGGTLDVLPCVLSVETEAPHPANDTNKTAGRRNTIFFHSIENEVEEIMLYKYFLLPTGALIWIRIITIIYFIIVYTVHPCYRQEIYDKHPGQICYNAGAMYSSLCPS
jgi:hypothetical protein